MTINVTVIYPASGKMFDLEPDPSLTPNALVNDLIEDNHLPRNPEGYELQIKGGAILIGDQSLTANKVESGATLLVLPMAKGGRGAAET